MVLCNGLHKEFSKMKHGKLLLTCAIISGIAASSNSTFAYTRSSSMHTLTHKTYSHPDNGKLILPSGLARWTDWVTLTGSVSLGGFASNRTPTNACVIPGNIGSSPSATDISVTFADLTFDAKPTRWLETLIEMSYQQQSPSFIRSPAGGGNVLFVNQAYMIFANPACSPFYAKFGRELIEFGGLDSTSLLESMTQLLTLTRATVAQVGFVDLNHFYGSLYGFRGLTRNSNRNTTLIDSVGARLAYDQKGEQAGYLFHIDYLSNIVSSLFNSSTVAGSSTLNSGFYHRAVSGLDLYAKANWRAYDISANYATALNSFSVLDVPYTTNGGSSFRGAEPAAWGANAGYSFDLYNYQTRFGIGYQGTSQAVALGSALGSVSNAVAGVYGQFFAIGMPRSRLYANYKIEFAKWVNLGMEVAGDKGYGSQYGGEARTSLIGAMVVTAKLA